MKIRYPIGANILDGLMCADNRVIGFGEIELDENDKSQLVCVDIGFLLNALNGLRTMGFEYIDLRVETDRPVSITNHKENRNNTKGVIVCPRVYDND